MKAKHDRKFYQKKRFIIPMLLIVGILILRFFLPTIARNHINQVLDELPGYSGSIGEIGISLFRGAYTVDDFVLRKNDAVTEIPLLTVSKADISIQWKALFNAEIVSEIYLDEPVLIYMFEDQDQQSAQQPDLSDWTKALDDLIPISINKLNVSDGKVGFVKLSAEPQIDMYVDQIDLRSDNLQLIRVADSQLPSNISARGVTIGGGTIEVEAKANLIKQIPDVDMSLSVEKINMVALNSLTKHYANIDFESGTLEVFSEIAIADGYLKGYFKPLLSNASLIGPEDGFLSTLWEGFVGFFKFIFKNQSTEKLATKIPVEGDLASLDASAWSTFVNILKNAWIEAFKDTIDEDIDFSDAQEAGSNNDQ